MARDEARIFTAIWQDDHFLSLSPDEQRLYLFLLSQPDLSYCGVIALRERRWSKKARGLTVEQVVASLAALAANPSGNPSPNPSGNPVSGPLVVVDEDAEEVLVRSLIRLDGIWKQPNLLKAAREAARLIQSPHIRRALVSELRRIPVEKSDSAQVKKVMAEFIAEFAEASGDPSGSLPGEMANPSPNPSDNPSADPSQGKGDGYGGYVEEPLIPGIPFPVPPTAGTAEPRPDAEVTAQTIVGEWIDRCKKRPPSNVIGQISKQIKAMLAEDIAPDDIRRGLAEWMTRDVHPSVLPSLVNSAMNATGGRAGSSNGSGSQLVERTVYDASKVFKNRKPA